MERQSILYNQREVIFNSLLDFMSLLSQDGTWWSLDYNLNHSPREVFPFISTS